MNVQEVWEGGSKLCHSLPPKLFFPGADALGVLPIPKPCQRGIFFIINYLNATDGISRDPKSRNQPVSEAAQSGHYVTSPTPPSQHQSESALRMGL